MRHGRGPSRNTGPRPRLTVELYDRDERLLFGPVHPTPLFEQLAPGHRALSMFGACVRRCLTQPAGASTIVVEQRHSFAIIGSSLTLDAEVVGAAVSTSNRGGGDSTRT